jgi:hypothetical protein
MMTFEKLEDALEEASWCAEQEKRKYIVRYVHKSFYVYPKRRKGVGRYSHIEVGFKRRILNGEKL